MKHSILLFLSALILLCPLLTDDSAWAQQGSRWWQRELARPSRNQQINAEYLSKRRELEIRWDTYQKDLKARRYFRSLGQKTPSLDEAIIYDLKEIDKLEYELSRIPIYVRASEMDSSPFDQLKEVPEDTNVQPEPQDDNLTGTNWLTSNRVQTFRSLVSDGEGLLSHGKIGSALDLANKALAITGFENDPDAKWLQKRAKEGVHKQMSDLVNAVKNGNVERVKDLATSVEIRYPGIGGVALVNACLSGHLQIVEYLVGLTGSNFFKYRWSWTPMGAAAWGGHISVITFLLNKGDDINYRHWEGNSTPLDEAVSSACGRRGAEIATVEFLIKNGADVNSRDSKGVNTALSTARRGMKSWANPIDVTPLLFRHGAVE